MRTSSDFQPGSMLGKASVWGHRASRSCFSGQIAQTGADKGGHPGFRLGGHGSRCGAARQVGTCLVLTWKGRPLEPLARPLKDRVSGLQSPWSGDPVPKVTSLSALTGFVVDTNVVKLGIVPFPWFEKSLKNNNLHIVNSCHQIVDFCSRTTIQAYLDLTFPNLRCPELGHSFVADSCIGFTLECFSNSP